MEIDIKVGDSCSIEKDFCKYCSSHFTSLRPNVKEAIASKRFQRDVKDEEEVNSIINSILDCAHIDFTELHKFEENVGKAALFRAKIGNFHIVYCIEGERIIFLRRIENFEEYKKFIDDKNEIKKMLEAFEK
jgi:mRNA-degrading endonuclease RelE of RelBE toxin-antitoxin system